MDTSDLSFLIPSHEWFIAVKFDDPPKTGIALKGTEFTLCEQLTQRSFLKNSATSHGPRGTHSIILRFV